MLIGIEGFLGDGKTTYLARCLKKDFEKGRKIFTNLTLYGIEYYYFDIDKFLNDENSDSLRNATIGIDEITTIMDCRLSSSKTNIAFGYLVLQSRKRNVDIYYTTQDIGLVDFKRLIKYTTIFVIAQRVYVKKEIENNKCIEEELKDWRNYTIIDDRQRKENVTSLNLKISDYYDIFDTDQIIKPPNLIKNKQVVKEKTDRIKYLESLLIENNIKYDK